MALNDVKEITIPECISPYRELEYIHFNGAESVHISYNPYNGMRWELTFKMDSATEGFSGAIGSSAAYHCTIGSSTNGYVAGWFLGAFRDYSSYPSTNKNTVILDRYQGKVWINDNLVYTGTAQYGSTTSNGMDFGARIDGSGNLGFYMKGNIYNSKISNAGTLIAEYIPAQRKSDGVCGLYRTSNSTFYPMTGTTITDAAAGPIINENPDWDRPIVKMIQDANGNIIWGSQSAFPYRRLEYIHFNGAEYIVENFGLSVKNRKMILDYTGDTWVNNATLLGQYDNNSVAENTRRLYIVRQATTNGNQLSHCVGNTWGAAVNASVNTRYLSTVTYTNASTNTLQVNIKNVSTGQTLIDTSFSGTGTSVQNFGAIGTLGACVNKMTNGTFIRNGFWTGKLYKFEKYVASTGTLQNNQIPCQRKSDGVCGLYDTVAQMFFPMTGTIITDAAAGPTADEYWDLTAPA